MSKLQELTAAIQKAGPEIMELKFGCKVKLLSEPEHFITITGLEDDENCLCGAYSRTGMLEAIDDINDKDEYKILGRDINLEDVMMCFGESKLLNNDKVMDLVLGGYNYSWTLGKPLHEQSEKTINLLHSIICQI